MEKASRSTSATHRDTVAWTTMLWLVVREQIMIAALTSIRTDNTQASSCCQNLKRMSRNCSRLTHLSS